MSDAARGVGPWVQYQQSAPVEEGPWAKYSGAPVESTFNQALRAAATMAVRGVGGAVDFAVDPLASMRTIVSPKLEHAEGATRFRPGRAAGNAVFEATGIREMQPESTWGRIGLAAGTGAVGGGPFGLAAAALSGLGGALGQGTMEAGSALGVSPDNTERAATVASFAPMGLAPAMRSGANFAVNKTKQTFGPILSESYRENLLGNEFLKGASDPEAVKAKLAEALAARGTSLTVAPGEIVPNWKPTAYQLTGDTGIGRQERTQRLVAERAAAQEGVPNPFMERTDAQTAALAAEARALAPEGSSSGAVRDLVLQRLAEIDQAGEAATLTLRPVAARALDDAGGLLPAIEQGAAMRGEVQASKTAFKGGVSRLWEDINPEKLLTIDANPVKAAEVEIRREMPAAAKAPGGEEAAIFGVVRGWNDVAQSFDNFSALRSRLTTAIRQGKDAIKSGNENADPQSVRRMSLLLRSMDDTIAGTAERASAVDEGVVGRLTQKTEGFDGGPTGDVGLPLAAGGENGLRPAQPEAAGRSEAPFGIPGTAGAEGRGPGSPAGNPRVQEPPRPQDLIQFLMDRGGLADNAGELRSMDLHKVNQGYFGRLSRKNGMPLDEAREIATEAGYLHRDSDINDLLNALRNNQHGKPVFVEGDPRVLDWLDFERARKTGDDVPFGEPSNFVRAAPKDQPFPPQPANFDAAAAARYRAAADARREQSRIYSNQTVGGMLDTRGGGEPRMTESRIPNHVISSTEGARAFLEAGGKPETLRDALVGDLRLRPGAIAADGTLNVGQYERWLARRAPALRESPEAAQMLSTAAKAQEAVDLASAASVRERQTFERSAARHFLNAEPAQAVQSALGGKNPVGDMAEIGRLVKGDPGAEAGLKRAIAEHVERNFIGNADAVKSDAFQTFVARNGPALSKVLDPAEVARYRALADALKQQTRSVSGTKLDKGGSNSPQDAMAIAGRGSTFRAYLWPGMAAGVVGLATYLHPAGGLVAAAVTATGAAKTVAMIKRAGLDKVDALRTEALLDPGVFSALMMKATPANRPFIAAKLNAALGRIVGAGAVSENMEKPPAKRTAR